MSSLTYIHNTAHWVAPLSHMIDGFPFLGTIKNVFDLFLRFCWKPEDLSELSSASRAYHKCLHEKTLLENILLLIPVLGIVVKIAVLLSRTKSYEEGNKVNRPETKLEHSLQELQEARDARALQAIEHEEELRLQTLRHREESILRDQERQEIRRRDQEYHEKQMALIEQERQRITKKFEDDYRRITERIAKY